MTTQKPLFAAVSTAVETNPAINPINIDFSLIKIGAPTELQPLGNLLSTNRRARAEAGSFHILARRLGALFDDILPSVPNLLKAYGRRASEIAEAAAASESSTLSESIFKEHIGIDSTTIWATATSGKAVIRMHLLACMLARMWSGQEATAIWAELVRYRQVQIRKVVEEEGMVANGMAYAAAAHGIEIEVLEEWDASARSWLQVGDKVKRKQQTQIKLMVDNLSVAIKGSNGKAFGLAAAEAQGSLYENVISNFSLALSTLDEIVSGVPQRVHAGGVLLALTSWHLYPDLVILGLETKEVLQNDALVGRGGVVRVSVSPNADQDGKHEQQGVYWSLALTNLRYYGTVQAQRSTLHDSTRLSVAQLQLLALGATLDQDSLTSVELSVRIVDYLITAINQRLRQLLDQSNDKAPPLAEFRSLQILSSFADGCQLLLHGEDVERRQAKQLVSYGSRHGREWICNPPSSPPMKMFNLADLRHLLFCVPAVHERISIPRILSKDLQVDPASLIIRYRTDAGTFAFAAEDATFRCSGRSRGTKRKRDEKGSTIPTANTQINIGAPHDEEWVFMYGSRTHDHQSSLSSAKEVSEIFDEWVRDDRAAGMKHTVIFDLVCGDPDQAAVFMRREPEITEPANLEDANIVPLEMVMDLLQRGAIDIGRAAAVIKRRFEEQRVLTSHGRALLALGRISEYYKSHLPEATVSMMVITKPISSWKWTDVLIENIEGLMMGNVIENDFGKIRSYGVYCSPISRVEAFACILQLESGTITADPRSLGRVMAISSGNSLFVANTLLYDPNIRKETDIYIVKHVVGNVGKPGIALLVAPAAQEIRKHNIEQWQYTTHTEFDGERAAGGFENTSIHLSFTRYEVPLSLEFSGIRGHEAYFLETKISLNDKGNWVADLDVLEAFESDENIRGLYFDGTCGHNSLFERIGHVMTSIDCWEEFLDPPGTIMVVRATTSRMARLAAVTLASQKRYICRYLTAGDEICWECVIRSLGRHPKPNSVIVL